MARKKWTMMERYENNLLPHNPNDVVCFSPIGLNFLDFNLRSLIGKTNKLEIGKCSHNEVIRRSLKARNKNPEHYCRRCEKFLNKDGIARWNDFLVFRNPKCIGPICYDCAKDNPDIWYKKFANALAEYKVERQSYTI
jgi:hypothetical protein